MTGSNKQISDKPNAAIYQEKPQDQPKKVESNESELDNKPSTNLDAKYEPKAQIRDNDERKQNKAIVENDETH